MKVTQILLVCFSIILLGSCKKTEGGPSAISPHEAEYTQPESGFTVSNYFSKLKDTVKFNNVSKNADSYEWDFGDGEKSNESSPAHVYKNKGKYKVNLLAKNGTKTSSFDTTIYYGLKTSVHFKFYVFKWLYSSSAEASLFNFSVRFYRGSTTNANKIFDCHSGIVQVYGDNGLISVDVPLDDETKSYSAVLTIENYAYCGNSYPPEIVEHFEPVNLGSFPFLNTQQIDQSLAFRRFIINYQISETHIE